MQQSSKLNKALWAFTYAVTAGVSVYGTMRIMNTDPEKLLAGWQKQPEKYSVVIPRSVVSAAQDKDKINNDDQQPGFQIGPFDSASEKKGRCDLSDSEIREAKEHYSLRVEMAKEQEFNFDESFDFLRNSFDDVKECPNNLRIYGVDKAQYLSKLRQSAVQEVQESYHKLAEGSDSGHAYELRRGILWRAGYAGISDDGHVDVATGLTLSHLPDESTLRKIEMRQTYDFLQPKLDIIHGYTGSGGQEERYSVFSALTEVKFSLINNPGLSSSLGMSLDQINQVNAKVIADQDREYEIEKRSRRLQPN